MIGGIEAQVCTRLSISAMKNMNVKICKQYIRVVKQSCVYRHCLGGVIIGLYEYISVLLLKEYVYETAFIMWCRVDCTKSTRVQSNHTNGNSYSYDSLAMSLCHRM